MKHYCVQCLKGFESAANSQLYCSVECRKAFAKADMEHKRKRMPSYAYCGRPSSGGHVFDLGLQEERRR